LDWIAPAVISVSAPSRSASPPELQLAQLVAAHRHWRHVITLNKNIAS
jgi:hypothetical protein